MLNRKFAWVVALLCAMVGNVAAQTTVEYIHTDALGSPVAITDAAGNVIQRHVYEPYGATVDSSIDDAPGFTGHVSDSMTGLTYMQQRYMDPELGVFMSVDPVTAHSIPVGNFNRYWYANNNPYRFTDPDGRLACRSGDFDCGRKMQEMERQGVFPLQSGHSDHRKFSLRRHKTPKSQERLIESVGGDPELLRAARASHEAFVLGFIEFGTGSAGARGAGFVFGKGTDVVRKSFFQGARLHPRVVSQMKRGDLHHAFPEAIDGYAEKHGILRIVPDSRNNPVEMLTLKGSYRGKDGTFEYIKNQSGEIYHRFFNVD